MKFEDLYNNAIYKYLDDDRFEENPTLLIPFIRETYLNKKAYKKAYDYICKKYSTEYASNVISMVADGSIGLYEPEQYISRKICYGTYVNLDVMDRLASAVNSYELKQLCSIESLTALLVRAINEGILSGRTDIRLNYLIETIALVHKATRERNKQVKIERMKLSDRTIKLQMRKHIGLLIDTLSTTFGKFNPVTIVIRDRNEWEHQNKDFRVDLFGQEIKIEYKDYIQMLGWFMEVFSGRCKTNWLNCPKIYINAKLTTNHGHNIYDAIYKFASSKYSYDDVYRSLLSEGINITYTGMEVPAVKNKIKEVLSNLEIVEDVDGAVEEIYKICRRKKDEIKFEDDDLNHVLMKTSDKLSYPNHKINRTFYAQKYGFCNWQSILSVSYVNYKKVTRKNDENYEVIADKLREAVINAQMLNMIKKFWYDKYSLYSVCLVSIQYVPEKLIPMVTDIVDTIITKLKSTYQIKFDFIIEDDRNFSYIQSAIRKREQMVEKQLEQQEYD